MSEPLRISSTLENLRAGHFAPEVQPVATVSSGDRAVIETISPFRPELLIERGVAEGEILEVHRHR